MTWSSSVLVKNLPQSMDLSRQNVSIGDLLCSISDDLCIDSLTTITQTIPVPDKIIDVLQWIQASVEWIFLGPLIGVPLVCLLQMAYFIKQVKTHLKQMYKGKCEFVIKEKSLIKRKAKIAIGSFHFGG